MNERERKNCFEHHRYYYLHINSYEKTTNIYIDNRGGKRRRFTISYVQNQREKVLQEHQIICYIIVHPKKERLSLSQLPRHPRFLLVESITAWASFLNGSSNS